MGSLVPFWIASGAVAGTVGLPITASVGIVGLLAALHSSADKQDQVRRDILLLLQCNRYFFRGFRIALYNQMLEILGSRLHIETFFFAVCLVAACFRL